MTTLFEQQGGQYKMQGDYRLPCVTLPDENQAEKLFERDGKIIC